MLLKVRSKNDTLLTLFHCDRQMGDVWPSVSMLFRRHKEVNLNNKGFTSCQA